MKKIKHPVVTVTVSVVCKAEDKAEVLESLNEWYFGKYAPSMEATGKPKVSKRREASKRQVEYFWDGFDEEDDEDDD